MRLAAYLQVNTSHQSVNTVELSAKRKSTVHYTRKVK